VTRAVFVAVVIAAAAATPAPAAIPTKQQYIARVNKICAVYGKQLDKIVPPDLAIPGNVLDALNRAIPIVQRENAAVRAVKPPPALKRDVAHFFVLADRSLAELKRMRARVQRRDLGGTARAFSRFTKARDAAQRAGLAIGFDC
jgi:hypothetical protein